MWRLTIATGLIASVLAGCVQPPPTPPALATVWAQATYRASLPTRTPTPTPTPMPSVHLEYSSETVYYPVNGTTTQQIHDAIEANGPTIPFNLILGLYASGLTEAQRSYEIEFRDYVGTCELQSIAIVLDIVVTLPEHSDTASLSTTMQKQWRDFRDSVAAHEQTHVDIYRERMEAFTSGVEHLPGPSSSCAALQIRIESVWLRERLLTDQQQEAFHEAEELRSRQLRDPIETQIDNNKLKLAEYQAELIRLSSQINGLEAQIADIGESMQPYYAAMGSIEDQYPGLVLPPDTFNEYERLRIEWSRLNSLSNGLIVRMNALIDQHNRIAEESSSLTGATNQLIEQLAWLP